MSEIINPPLVFGIVFGLIFYFAGWTTIIILLLIILGLLGAVYFNQNKLLYMPGKNYS